MEYWDILDEHGKPTGKTVRRGEPMEEQEYHLVVQIWIVNHKGEFLISKRTPNKPFGNMWETTGGSAVAGEDSITAALREVREELGIGLLPENGRLFQRYKRGNKSCPDFVDIWVFHQNIRNQRIVFQPDETCGAIWAGKEKIVQMIADHEFVVWGGEHFPHLHECFDFAYRTFHIPKIPTRKEAEGFLNWAYEQNPGPWADHSRVVARVAETIAMAGGLDAERAYVSGLLHDIGRYEGVRALHHIYAGYELLREKGYEAIAEICLTHSFQYQDLRAYIGGDYDCSDEELLVISSFLSETTYNDYDRLIQLGDSMGSAQGVCLLEKRLLDVVRRYGFNNFTLKKWDAVFTLKNYFDTLCGRNVYDLFYDEIRTISFM